MNAPFTLIALCAGLLSLSACDKTPTTPATPVVINPMPTESAAAAGPVTDPSLPSAESVFSRPNTTNVDTTPGRPDGTINPTQEAMGTPIPGQNNDHSAPAAPVQAASAP